MTTHSRYAPSAAHRWMRCAASLAAEGSEETEYSKWGTDCHEIGARLLLTGLVPAKNGDEMVDTAIDYVTAVKSVVGKGVILGVECQLDFNHLLPDAGTEDQGGTIDCVALSQNGNELQIHDLKTGKGVLVYAEDNEQLMLYGLCALERFEMLADIQAVRLVIHQQRAGHFSEHVMTVEELRNFGEAVRERISDIEIGLDAAETPGEKQCRWCARKAECQAYEKFVHDTVGAKLADMVAVAAEVDDMGHNRLAVAMAAVPMIEQWCLAIRAKVEGELLAGRAVDGFKLVQGRKGNRKWADEPLAIKTLKSMKLLDDEVFTKTVISPPAAEKLKKIGRISDKQFGRLAENIVQAEGSLSVAISSDPRPAASLAASPEKLTEMMKSEL
jgi:hypothetical protein